MITDTFAEVRDSLTDALRNGSDLADVIRRFHDLRAGTFSGAFASAWHAVFGGAGISPDGLDRSDEFARLHGMFWGK